jgi:hypothetical protein
MPSGFRDGWFLTAFANNHAPLGRFMPDHFPAHKAKAIAWRN